MDYDGSAPLYATGMGEVFSGLDFVITYTGTETASMSMPAVRAHSGTWLISKLNVNRLYFNLDDGEGDASGPQPVTQLLQLLGVGGGTDGSGLLAAGTWKCAGNSLSISPPAGNGASGAWTWARTGG